MERKKTPLQVIQAAFSAAANDKSVRFVQHKSNVLGRNLGVVNEINQNYKCAPTGLMLRQMKSARLL